MRRSLAKFSESEASNHTPSLADFTTATPELSFRYTQGKEARRDTDLSSRQVYPCCQSQDCQHPGSYDPADATSPRRRGDRITILFAALHESVADLLDGLSEV